jgi:hypothetical protein
LDLDAGSANFTLSATPSSTTSPVTYTLPSTLTLATSGSLKSFSFVASNTLDGLSEQLIADGTPLPLAGTSASTGTFTSGGLTWKYDRTAGSRVVVITLDSGADMTAAQATTLLKTMTYTNSVAHPSLDPGTRVITFKTIDTDNNEVSTTLSLNIDGVTTPLMLDLNGDGVRTSDLAHGVLFDVNATGTPVQTGWSDGKDGLLVLDLNQDGQIHNGSELFGSGTELFTGGKAQDGYVALRQYDLNADGVINAQDAVFKDLKLWVDANIDGLTDAGELRSLAELGVASLNLDAITGTQVDQGNTLGLVSNWTDAKGQVHDMADVWFSTATLEDLVRQATGEHMLDPVPNTGAAVTVDSRSYGLWNHATAHLMVAGLQSTEV